LDPRSLQGFVFKMAANFWNSTHCKHWILTPDKLKETHKKDKEKLKFTDEEIKKVKIHFALQIETLGKRLHLRQRVMSTAIVLMRRFYVKYDFCEFCPKLIAPSCLYVASKVEESSTHAPASKFESEMKMLDSSFPYKTADILECEFYIIEAMDYHLIIFHPYRTLAECLQDCGIGKEKEFLEYSWNLVNDSYCTEVSLLYPPYIIALGCIYISSFLKERDLRLWFSELNVEMKDVWMVVDEIMNFYEGWTEKDINLVLSKLIIHDPLQSKASSGKKSASSPASRRNH